MEGTYITFGILPRDSKKKTDTWEVRNKESNALLGEVKWYGAWRRYCFFVDGSFVFEQKCMREISAFIERETKLYMDNKKQEKL